MTLRLEMPEPTPLRGVAGFDLRSGVAVPDDLQTLGAFQGLQRAINAADFTAHVAVDGVIGGQTLARTRELVSGFNPAQPQIEILIFDAETLASDPDAVRAALENEFFLGDISREPDLATAAPAVKRRFGADDAEDPDEAPQASDGGGGAKIGLLLLGVGAIGLAFFASATEDLSDEEAAAMQQAALTGT